MTTTDHADHIEHIDDVDHDAGHVHKPNGFYIKVALALAMVTGIEVALYYLNLGS